MNPEAPRLPARNVELFDAGGAVIAGFWQYGTLTWEDFYAYLALFIVTASPQWSVFQYNIDDAVQRERHRGPPCPCPGSTAATSQIVQPGEFCVRVGLVATPVRPRVPTRSNTPSSPLINEHDYRSRTLARDGKCLITGLHLSSSRLQVAHIFPRAHETEWTSKGYPSKITDPGPSSLACMGGPSKIDSVQNALTLRSDLHSAWANYEFGVDPNDNHRITSFTNGNADIHGLHLHLSHISDATLRPLDDLLLDHFTQGILKYMRGRGPYPNLCPGGAGVGGAGGGPGGGSEGEWTYDDYEDVFEGYNGLANPKVWETREGKEGFELVLADRLHALRVAQEGQEEEEGEKQDETTTKV